jgi:dinuclear metal center YbgI/SA1388 family protein
MDNLFLENYINELLNIEQFQDYAPNGLQIEGRKKIRKIATAVTASKFVLERCLEENIDALFVHHGYFWKGEASVIKGLKYKRLSTIIKNDLNLFAYHLPLDTYPEWGNNACIAKKIGIQVTEKRSWNKTNNLLWLGLLPVSHTPEKFLCELKELYGNQVVHVSSLKNEIKNIAWCSGGAQDLFEEAIKHDIDAYITGEFSERTYHLAKEANVDFFALGHHASEKDGVIHLGDHLAHKFDLEHHFIDEDNPF